MDFINEVVRFIKNNIKKMIVLSLGLFVILIGVLVAGSLLGKNGHDYKSKDDQAISEYYEQQFSFLVEDSQGDVVNNPELIEEELKLTGLVKEIEASYDVTLVPELVDADQNITITSNDSGLHQLTISLPDQQKSNEIAHLFRDLVVGKKLKVLEDRKVSLIGDVRLLQDEEKILENTRGINGMKYLTTKYILLMIIVSISLSIVFIIIKEWLSPTLNYVFSYDADKHEQLIVLSKQEIEENPDNFQSLLLQDDNTLWLAERDPIILANDTLTTVSKVTPNDIQNMSKAIIVIEPFYTKKQWYKEQLQLCKWHQLPMSILQLNDLKK